ERERLLAGNWKIKAAAGKIFNRAWFPIVEARPAQVLGRVRYWDKASVEEGGDWSAGVLMSMTDEALYYLHDVLRGQWSSRDRNKVMIQTAGLDGVEVDVWCEEEGGSGGKESAELSVRLFAGYNIHTERVTGDKVTRARQLSAQAEVGNVRIVKGS